MDCAKLMRGDVIPLERDVNHLAPQSRIRIYILETLSVFSVH